MTERFTLLSELGRGGMGVVWKARDEETGQIVALKLLRQVYAEDPDYVTRFERELELAKRIHSRNVVQVLGFGVREGMPYLALEYVDGPSLREHLASHGPYSWPETKALLAQIAQGLADAHAAGVVHRDLKPSNVLIGSDGIAKLADFGIAKGLDLTRVTGTSTLLGTPAYLPPEGPNDERSDLYSLGVIAYETLTGTVPFEGRTYQEVILRHVREAPDLDRLPAEARPIVGWLLAKDAAERPQRAADLLPVLFGGAEVPPYASGQAPPVGKAVASTPKVMAQPPVTAPRATPAPPMRSDTHGAPRGLAYPPTPIPYDGRRRDRTPLIATIGALGLVACVAIAALAGTFLIPQGAGAPIAAGCTVGVSWNNYQEERWAKWDEPAIKAALTTAGCSYISTDAKSSSDTQLSNVDALINQGAKALIVLAQDGVAIKPAVAKALAAGIPVIAYDRLIEDTGAFYITFDNVLVGKLQAAALLKVKSSGNFVVIKGNKADANSDFLRKGMAQAGVPDVGHSTDTLKNVGETYTDNWDPANAQTEMEQLLTANSNKIDIAFVENDGMAGGVIAALKSQGLAGTVPVSGQDGDAAALNRIALGTQTVDVWKDLRMLGDAAGQVAAQLAKGTAKDKITTDKYGPAINFASPGGNSLDSILLTPQAITKDNLQIVLDAQWIDKSTLCRDVAIGSVNGC